MKTGVGSRKQETETVVATASLLSQLPSPLITWSPVPRPFAARTRLAQR